jgi:hypothetical protein
MNITVAFIVMGATAGYALGYLDSTLVRRFRQKRATN